ncbi:S8 family serine peptidase [Dyadobacter sp. CY261]|uniref:S8 family peptidase n=1 Tax=Dyadobacter sp. CY261 TaxID=2907203 RepID=UPI001F225D3B|nr:S8 family serine peptidase [Dyadobacter sp. CY261]MCF0068869.1 S8 family serine peptidase [Dyadobacter sp. CY261]
MAIFIVRPKSSLGSRTVGLISKNFKPEDRQRQISELVGLRSEDPCYKELNRWLDQSPASVTSLAPEARTPVTGTKIVDMSEEEATKLRQDLPDLVIMRDRPVGLIEPAKTNSTTKTRVLKKDLWHLDAIGLTDIKKRGFTGTGKGVTIAVLDTGIDATHPELSGKVMGAYTFNVNTWQTSFNGTSIDTQGHGTHVAGLICGKNVGVAPEAKVVSGTMLPGGRGNISDFILALEWAASDPTISIVNISAGIPGNVPDMMSSVAALLGIGILPVIAAGNEGRNKTRSPGNYVDSLSVGASNQENKVSSFSSGGVLVADNHRYEVPDVVAPGEQVWSSVMGGGYEAWDGTSMATPIVSGVAALILEKYPEITVTDLIEGIVTSCKNLAYKNIVSKKTLNYPPERQGSGLIQAKPLYQ